MSETKDDKTISVSSKKTLTLKRSGVEQGTVRQDMGRGRTKAVVVETRKRRISRPEDDKSAALTPGAKAKAPTRDKTAAKTPAEPSADSASSAQSAHELSASEMDARKRALENAKIRDAEEREIAEQEAVKRAEEDARRKVELEEEAKRKAEEDALREKEEPQQAEPAAAAAEVPVMPEPEPTGRAARVQRSDDDQGARGKAQPQRGKPSRPETPKPTRPRGDDSRRRGKLTLNTALNEDGNQRGRSLSAMRRRQEKMKRAQNQEPREKIAREVTLPETITIQELSQRMAERSVDVIKYLMKEGQMMKPGDVIDADLAELIAGEFGHTVKRVAESDIEVGIFDIEDDEKALKPRPPIVTIMGHVDHGKTSLLDAIRNANVVSGEAGGITQHIGAYQVEQNGQKITFIDTPGHAAFTAMRARGAQATDIAILVVAADDSVMPQTIESINHAKAAEVPIIVAINKIDKPEADANKVRTELLQHEVFVESMGGEVLDVEVSATKGTNLDKLLEAILLQSEILDLKANPDRTAEGAVIEAQLDRGRGSVATVLVEAGTLHTGDIVVAGDEWGPRTRTGRRPWQPGQGSRTGNAGRGSRTAGNAAGR